MGTPGSLMNNLDWLTSGVNFSIPGDGGPTCKGFTEDHRRWSEGGFFFVMAITLLIYCSRNCHLPDADEFIKPSVIKDNPIRRYLLTIVSLVFGMQIAFKLSSRTAIYLLNPCHVMTAAQIYLLAAAPSKMAAAVFRFHLAYMNGGVIALVFPVTNTLFLPFETEIFYMQHILILIVPFCLLSVGGAYSLDKWSHWGWPLASYGGIALYHYVILPPIAVVNLSQTLCPAVTDPFYGPHYRPLALLHQGLFMPFLVRVYLALASILLNIPQAEDIAKARNRPEIETSYSDRKEQVTNNNDCVKCS